MMYLLLNSIKMGLCTLKDKANLFALPISHYQNACNPLCISYAIYVLKNIYRFLKSLLKHGKLEIILQTFIGAKQSMH